MPEVMLASHTIQSHGFKVARIHLHDWLILIVLIGIIGTLNYVEPFHRFINEGLMTDCKYPFKHDTVPFWAVPIIAGIFPIIVFCVYYCVRRDIYDLHHAVLGLMYALLITGVITDSIKDTVGRPRPNFFWRCFPDGKAVFDSVTGDVICHGDPKLIKEGYKSFPSGHTSWSFAGLVFLSWYMSGKIKVFDRRGHIAKLCVVLLPILLAAFIGVSRVDDYWHHWTDVFTGAILGTIVSSICYLQLFPYPHDVNGWAPHAYFHMMRERTANQSLVRRASLNQIRQADIENAYPASDHDEDSPDSHSQGRSPSPFLGSGRKLESIDEVHADGSFIRRTVPCHSRHGSARWYGG
ncbi:hypothetical protein ACFE04_009069 [Oxalis oulophora]